MKWNEESSGHAPMVLTRPVGPLRMQELPDRAPGTGEIGVRVTACGVCRTDLHVVDGELPDPEAAAHSGPIRCNAPTRRSTTCARDG